MPISCTNARVAAFCPWSLAYFLPQHVGVHGLGIITAEIPSTHYCNESCPYPLLDPRQYRKHIDVSTGHSTTVMSLLLSELVLRHEGVVRRAGTNPADGAGAAAAAAGGGGGGGESEFLSEANVLEILSDLVLHLPACATAIHRLGCFCMSLFVCLF